MIRFTFSKKIRWGMLAIVATSLGMAARVATGDVPGFRRDVMPVFFRAGCNTGACHGAAGGKDGFMLSLFGYDVKGDYERIVSQIPGRRINVAAPDESLLFLKATGGVPHTGGKLFDKESDLAKTLLAWIAAGAPDDAANVPDVIGISLPKESVLFTKIGQHGTARVMARYSDGSFRDVTALARFFSNNPSVADIDADGRVTAKGPGDTSVFGRFNRFTVGTEVIVLTDDSDFVWPNPPINNFIDTLVFDRLEKLRIVPSDLCDDETFLRRVTLDLVARPPTGEEYEAFMADASADKRAKKIDALLATTDFADYWAALWAEQLRVMGDDFGPHGRHVKASESFIKWIRDQMRAEKPLDRFVAEMVTASGSNIHNGPVSFRIKRLAPKDFAADFSQILLGIQINCAECHNHPFDRWTQDDYYGFVSFFTGHSWKPGGDLRERRLYFDATKPLASHPIDGRPMPPKAIGAVDPACVDGDPRKALALWLTSPDNRLFSRNLANRIWAHFLGRGIVEPVDDVRVSNPPSNGPLLEALATRLTEAKFDLKALVRDICCSRVYQLSGTPTPSNAGDSRHFSHARLRRLRADVLLDSIVAVMGKPHQFKGFSLGARAIDFYPRSQGISTDVPTTADGFLGMFGRSPRGTACACETKTSPTLSQTMHFVVGNTLQSRLSGGGVVERAMAANPDPCAIIESLYIRALSRKPRPAELSAMRQLVGDRTTDVAVYEDVLWGLMNSTEFGFSH